ncbi:hypothetical protein BJX63DRAFT_61493 [Aspergillus granulosus]|uniref:Trichothecene 3-O-acetyltransferase-like N-terminal domain-containing protein n=1 Tax=Aspergillus granulosus TaxID=176169 RepID=A0ABR4GX00_9EURO
MGSTGTVHIPLSPLDHAPPGNYSCSLNYIPLKPGVTPKQAFDVLHEGLHRTFVQIPWLSGRVWPQAPGTPGYRPGQREIRYEPVDISGPRPYQLKFNVLADAPSYEDLKEAAFPTDSFQDESVVWATFMPDVNDGPEVLVAQANFIPGACVLSAGMYHSAADGVGGVVIFKLWADNCRALQAGLPPPIAPGPESSNRALLEEIWAREREHKPLDQIDPMNWTLLGLAPPSTKPAPEEAVEPQAVQVPEIQGPCEPRSLKSAIFYVPPAKFNKLQRECAEAGEGISGTDAICALIWQCALRARFTAAQKTGKYIGEISNPDALAFLAMTADGRPHFSSNLPNDYMGNLTCINLPALPLRMLVAPETSLATVAQTIRNGANSITTENLLDAYALARSVPDYGHLSLQNPPLDSATMLVSPLLTYPTNSVSFGDIIFENGGTLEALRMPMYSFNRMTRLSLVLPRLASGGVEFLLNLFEEEMEILLKDESFRKYAMFLTN